MSIREIADKQRERTQEKDFEKAVYLGNIYGLHDGYDGSVFSVYGICKTIMASVGGIACVLVKTI